MIFPYLRQKTNETKPSHLLCRWLGHKYKIQPFYKFKQCQRCWAAAPPLTVDIYCNNCGVTGFAEVNRPQEVVSINCPNCGCQTLTLN